MCPDLPCRVTPGRLILRVIHDVTLAEFVILNALNTIYEHVRPGEQVDIVVAVIVVEHVYPFQGLAIQLREEGVVTVLVAVESGIKQGLTVFCILPGSRCPGD